MKLRIYRFTQFKNRRRATHVRALCKFAEAANEEKKKKRKTRGRAMKKKKREMFVSSSRLNQRIVRRAHPLETCFFCATRVYRACTRGITSVKCDEKKKKYTEHDFYFTISTSNRTATRRISDRVISRPI